MMIQVLPLGCISSGVSTWLIRESDCLNDDVGDTGDGDEAKFYYTFAKALFLQA